MQHPYLASDAFPTFPSSKKDQVMLYYILEAE